MLVGSNRLQINNFFCLHCCIMQSVLAWSSWEGTALLHRGSAGLAASGSFKAGFRCYNSCCFSLVPGGTAWGVCRLETPLSVSIWVSVSGSGWLSPALSPSCLELRAFGSYSVKTLLLFFLHLLWLCCVGQESIGPSIAWAQGPRVLFLSLLFPQLGVDWLGKGRCTLPSPLWASALVQMVLAPQMWGLGRRRKAGRKSGGLGPPPHQEPQLGPRHCWV